MKKKPISICVVGAGHVGLVTAVCFAELGHPVVCVDQDRAKLRGLQKGRPWFYEPDLAPLLKRNLKAKRIFFAPRISEGVKRSEVIFIAVGTPPLASGDADLTSVEQVVREIAGSASGYRLIVEKSTVPVETGRKIQETLRQISRKSKVEIEVASNPEFLREGSAVHDFFHPDRIVLGVGSPRARELLENLYRPLNAPMLATDIQSAELIKHASNAFLATKISFINAVSVLCDRVGADVEKVAQGLGLDSRIGPAFLRAGIGYGGFCFPKDLEAFIRIAEKLGYDFELLKATRRINEQQKRILVEKITQALWNLKGKKIGLLGLAFKPGTDDLRFAPSLEIIQALRKAQARVSVHDPKAMEAARPLLKEQVTFAKSAYDLARGADCLVVVTEWGEFKTLDLARIKRLMRNPLIVDGRNFYDPQVMKKLGFQYAAIGRPNAEAISG